MILPVVIILTFISVSAVLFKIQIVRLKVQYGLIVLYNTEIYSYLELVAENLNFNGTCPSSSGIWFSH